MTPEEKIKEFASSLMPMLLNKSFTTSEKYKLIEELALESFKHGVEIGRNFNPDDEREDLINDLDIN